MGGNGSSEKSSGGSSSGGSKTEKQKKADAAYAKAIKENPDAHFTGSADLLKVLQGKNLKESGYNKKVQDAYNAQQAANMEAKNMMADGTQKDDDKPVKKAAPITTQATTTSTTPTTSTTSTTQGNAASVAESTSADTLQSSQQGVTISDEAKAKASALNLELVNTDAIQGTNEADTLQKKQAALLEAERRQAIRRLIARNRRARFGGSRLLMSSARLNPGLGVSQEQTTSLSPRMNPRDIYA